MPDFYTQKAGVSQHTPLKKNFVLEIQNQARVSGTGQYVARSGRTRREQARVRVRMGKEHAEM